MMQREPLWGGIDAGVTTSRPALFNGNFQPVLDVVLPNEAQAFLEALAPFDAFEIQQIGGLYVNH